MKAEDHGLMGPAVTELGRESGLSLPAAKRNNPLRFSLLFVVSLFIFPAMSAQGQTVTTTVAVGKNPGAVALNPVTNKVYVANSFGTVTVIDGASNKTSTVTDGGGPDAVAVNPVTNKVYVTNGSGTVTVIDGASNATSTVTVGTVPFAVAVNPVTNKIYVVNQSG